MSNLDPWGQERLLGPYARSLRVGNVTLCKMHVPGLHLFQLLQEKRLKPLWAQLGFSTGLPASAALAEQTNVFSALHLSRDEHTAFNVTTSSSISLHCSFWKLVLFARQHLVSSSVVPWTVVTLRCDDWIWDEDQIEKQVVCQNDGMSALDVQTSCLMHFGFKLHRLCSIYQGKTMTYDSDLPDRMGFSVCISYSCPTQVIMRYLESCT